MMFDDRDELTFTVLTAEAFYESRQRNTRRIFFVEFEPQRRDHANVPTSSEGSHAFNGSLSKRAGITQHSGSCDALRCNAKELTAKNMDHCYFVRAAGTTPALGGSWLKLASMLGLKSASSMRPRFEELKSSVALSSA